MKYIRTNLKNFVPNCLKILFSSIAKLLNYFVNFADENNRALSSEIRLLC